MGRMLRLAGGLEGEKPEKKRKNGEEEMRERKASPSDLTDAEWELLEPMIPAISPEAVRVEQT